jgi:ubiquinone/menaquinone biosynthesis C-methylase UbiE
MLEGTDVMPVNEKQLSGEVLYQRAQYQIKGVSRWYWDYKDRSVMGFIQPNDMTILDIGCGEGIMLEKLGRSFPDRTITGIDFMEENVGICERCDLPAKQGDIYSLDLPDNYADVILLMEVIEHLKDPQAAVAQLHRVLKPGGRLIVVYPNDKFFLLTRLLLLRFKEAHHDPGHVRLWTPGQIRKFLSENGFAVVSARTIPLHFWPISLHGITVGVKPNLTFTAPF